MVECFLAKEDVAGSTPVSRSNQTPSAVHFTHILKRACVQRESQGRGTQVVRERSAKPLCVGSIPTRASNISSVQSGKYSKPRDAILPLGAFYL